MDGIDAVLCNFGPQPPAVLAKRTVPFEPQLRALLDQLRADPDRFPSAALARLDTLLGDAFAAAALAVMADADLAPEHIRAIGSHGQTALHRPQSRPPHTLQIADPHRIAARTGVLTVADFRRADLAAGGQGAPLAPLLHQALLANTTENRVVVNLGGIANISVLPANGAFSGFDTGPANCFLDYWYRQHQSGPHDSNGSWAASGTPDADWLQTLLGDPYFALPPPKSTGIEYFSPAWLRQRLPDWAAQRPADIQATLLALSASSIAQAISALPATQRPRRVIACGGGVHNLALLDELGSALGGLPIESSLSYGLDPDQVEALLFAWLARERLAGRLLPTPAITGATHPVLAGALFAPAQGPDQAG